jgi:hypothetical protein
LTEPAKTTERVNVQLPDGRMGTVAAKDVASVLDQRGRVVSDAEFAKAQRDLNLEAKYSGVGGFVHSQAANIAGGLRGLSAGLSDPLLIKGAGLVGQEEAARSQLSEYQEAFPVESLRGEVGGVVIPAVASGGARAPMGVSGILARGGAAIERSTLQGLTRGGAGLAERALVKGLAVGAQGAAEGAVYGVGHQISEASLGNHELTADKLLAGAKGGALYGFVGGAALGSGGELVSGAIKAAIPKTFAITAEKEGGTLSQWLEKKAGEMTLRHAGADKRLVSSLDKYAEGGGAGVGRLLADEAPALVGKQRVGQMTHELWAEAAARGKQLHGAAMDGVLASAGKGSANIRVHEIVDEIRRTADPFRTGAEHIGKQGVVKQIDGFAEDVGRRFGLYGEGGQFANPDAVMNLKDLHGIRRSADDLWAGNKINPIATPIKSVRDGVNVRLASEIEKAGGPEALQAWQEANQRWQAFNALGKATANQSARTGANQFLSLTDKIVGSAGAAIGSVVGGGPVGAVVGGAVTGLASKAIRGRFDAVGAEMLLKAARLGAAKELAGSVDAQLGQAVRGFLSQGAKEGSIAGSSALAARANMPQAARVGGVSREDYERTAGQVAQLSMRRKDGQMGGHGLENFSAAAPNVAAALAATHSRAVQYLAALMPPARVDHSSSFVPGSMYMPKALSPAELKWLRSVEAVKDPMGVLKDFRKGHISGDQVDALKNVYPSLYAHLRQTVMEHAQKSGRKLSVEQVSALGILLREPVHYTQRPEFLVAMQASKATAAPLEEPGGTPNPSRQPDIESGAARAGTASEAIER